MTKNAVSTSSYHGLGNKSIVLRILIILFGFLFFWLSSYLFPNGNAYEAVNICQALPEELIPKQSGAKVVLKLDSAEKFFGIHFKNRLF